MISRRKLPIRPKLKAKLRASSLCSDDRVMGSRSTRSLAANLDRLRLLTNWAHIAHGELSARPSSSICHVTSPSATGRPLIGRHR